MPFSRRFCKSAEDLDKSISVLEKLKKKASKNQEFNNTEFASYLKSLGQIHNMFLIVRHDDVTEPDFKVEVIEIALRLIEMEKQILGQNN